MRKNQYLNILNGKIREKGSSNKIGYAIEKDIPYFKIYVVFILQYSPCSC